MARRDVSQKVLADALKITQQSTSFKVRGRTRLTLDDVVVIAGALGVPPRTLLAPLLDGEPTAVAS